MKIFITMILLGVMTLVTLVSVVTTLNILSINQQDNIKQSSNEYENSNIEFKKIERVSDIIPINEITVKPLAYTSVVNLGELEVNKKKEAFIAIMLPSILLSKQKMAFERKKIISLLEQEQLSDEEQIYLDNTMKRFQAKDEQQLLSRMTTHPTSIVLAQAAIESGWGSSRFFLKANNVFGIWSFSTNDNRIAAGETRSGKTIYLKDYKTLQNSVYDYFVTLSASGPYQAFRDTRKHTKDPNKLVEHLGQYSELGELYIENLKTVIRQNNLTQYDKYVLEG
ncbi:glucosaminidase domain-containing protein [bacterium]|nr:glucosaminidase domain-containing protein [bacterium]MBU1993915.1 glucosaminidase domain-containing protein [bacterium]